MRFWLFVELLGTAGALFLLVTAFRLEPEVGPAGAHVQLGLPPCGYQQQTGDPCLSCGMTTAFTNMAHLRPAAALRANPGGVLLFALSLAAPFWLLHAAWSRRDPFRFLRHPLGRWVLPAVVLVTFATWLGRLG